LTVRPIAGRKGSPRADDYSHVVVSFDDNRLMPELFGEFDQNLARLEQRLGVEAVARGNQVTLRGVPEATVRARLALDILYGRLQEGHEITPGDVDGALRMAEAAEAQLSLPSLEPRGRLSLAEIATRRRTVMARTPGQDAYIRAFDRADLTFGIGPAGTGKTYLAVAKAVQALQAKQVTRIILTRPAVEAGERLGFLPGTLVEKIDPYLRPLMDALQDMVDQESIPRLMQAGTIEIAPLAYMRGRSLNGAFIILDEAQNTTPEQMKMFLTRIGFGSKAVITGDVTQIDLPTGKRSGLVEAERVLAGVEGIEFVYFTEKDVVRHKLVQMIIKAYESHTKKSEIYFRVRCLAAFLITLESVVEPPHSKN